MGEGAGQAIPDINTIVAITIGRPFGNDCPSENTQIGQPQKVRRST
ncbi:hypothetical protein [Reyranella massiliensis]|nr:hypothetical protein [Reyranella massiliensis]